MMRAIVIAAFAAGIRVWTKDGIAEGVERFKRVIARGLLVGLDLARALLIGALPWVTELWQVYGLIFLLNACSAGFTTTGQPACVASRTGSSPTIFGSLAASTRMGEPDWLPP